MDKYEQIRQTTTTGHYLGMTFSILVIGMLSIFSPVSSDASENKSAAAASDKPYSLDAEGRIDWYTFSGYRRYHAVCHTCHGPAGLGGSFAPSLLDAINKKGLTYERYFEVMVNGIKNIDTTTQSGMPSFAIDLNVMCFVDDIYAYLIARADGVLKRTRPAKKQPKPEAAKERDKACFG